MEGIKIFLLFLSSVTVSQSQSINNIPIDEKPIVEFLSQKGARSMVIGIINDNEQYIKGYGNINRFGKHKKAPDGNTLFEVGSITKTFTSLLLVRLQYEGLVHLDSSIIKYLDQEQEVDSQLDSVTLKHLATHTAGLPRITSRSIRPALVIDLFMLNPSRNPYRWYGINSLYKDLRDVTFAHPIGKQFAYSNFGVGLLGHGLSIAARMPFDQAIHKYVTQPLHMMDTHIVLTKQHRRKLAKGHNRLGMRVPSWELGEGIQGAGAIVSSMKDMMKFLQINLSKESTLSALLLDSCHKPIHEIASHSTQVGLGWFQTKLKDSDQVITWHNGGTGGFTSFIGFDKDAGTGIVILSNSTHNVDELAFSLLRNLTSHHERL